MNAADTNTSMKLHDSAKSIIQSYSPIVRYVPCVLVSIVTHTNSSINNSPTDGTCTRTRDTPSDIQSTHADDQQLRVYTELERWRLARMVQTNRCVRVWWWWVSGGTVNHKNRAALHTRHMFQGASLRSSAAVQLALTVSFNCEVQCRRVARALSQKMGDTRIAMPTMQRRTRQTDRRTQTDIEHEQSAAFAVC